jgi:ADP-dependent NAD(P)H-hydrate dehydratase / NAD(P)H-hydrate epimerase
MHIVSVDEMRALETRAAEEYGLTSPILMENAGRSAAEILARYIAEKDSQKRSIDSLEFFVLVGPGNNGGDGMVMARYLAQWGGHISSYRWKEQQLTIHGEPAAAGDVPTRLEEVVKRCDYVLDALLGTGRSRPLPDSMRSLLGREIHCTLSRWICQRA